MEHIKTILDGAGSWVVACIPQLAVSYRKTYPSALCAVGDLCARVTDGHYMGFRRICIVLEDTKTNVYARIDDRQSSIVIYNVGLEDDMRANLVLLQITTMVVKMEAIKREGGKFAVTAMCSAADGAPTQPDEFETAFANAHGGNYEALKIITRPLAEYGSDWAFVRDYMILRSEAGQAEAVLTYMGAQRSFCVFTRGQGCRVVPVDRHQAESPGKRYSRNGRK